GPQHPGTRAHLRNDARPHRLRDRPARRLRHVPTPRGDLPRPADEQCSGLDRRDPPARCRRPGRLLHARAKRLEDRPHRDTAGRIGAPVRLIRSRWSGLAGWRAAKMPVGRGPGALSLFVVDASMSAMWFVPAHLLYTYPRILVTQI